MNTEITLDAIRSIIAEEIRRFAEEQAVAKAARPKARVELTAEEAAQYMTVDEVAAVTGYGVPSLRSMAAKKMTPEVFPLLPVKVGMRSLYVRADVLASAKAKQFVAAQNGAPDDLVLLTRPKILPQTQTMLVDGKGELVGAIGASIQNVISASKPAAKKTTAPAAKQAKTTKQTVPAAKKATTAAKKPTTKPAPKSATTKPAAKKATRKAA